MLADTDTSKRLYEISKSDNRMSYQRLNTREKITVKEGIIDLVAGSFEGRLSEGDSHIVHQKMWVNFSAVTEIAVVIVEDVSCNEH